MDAAPNQAYLTARHVAFLDLDSTIVEISPAPLNKGERMFVEDLKAFYDGHPDFIAWQVDGTKQFVSFVDPNVVLSSFIVSNTPAFRMEQQWGITRAEMDGLNILFQDEDRDTYIETMLARARLES